MSARKPINIVRTELRKMIREIAGEQSALGITDSGFSGSSMRVTGDNPENLTVSATQYLKTNIDDVGRKPSPGKWPVGGILQWGKLSPVVGQTRLQAAYAVARSIAEHGTEIYNGKRGIDIESITQTTSDAIAFELAKNEGERANDIFIIFK